MGRQGVKEIFPKAEACVRQLNYHMNKEPTFSYDKEADVLYISFFTGEKAKTALELNENILLRFNRAKKRAIGLTLMDFQYWYN